MFLTTDISATSTSILYLQCFTFIEIKNALKNGAAVIYARLER